MLKFMRKIFPYKFRFAALFCLVLLLFSFPLFTGSRTVFPAGEEYTLYCGSASSQAKIITCRNVAAPALRFLYASRLTGESTVYKKACAEELIETYNATILFSEDTAGVLSYYCYSPDMGAGVLLQGKSVNLHIACKQDGSVAIGTPLIFGGF